MFLSNGKSSEPSAVAPLFSAAKADTRRSETVLALALAQAKKHGAFSEEMTITPVVAELLLKNNPDNRVISKRIVERYVADMKAGRWVMNGEPIIIAETGELNDGQHRCAAVVESGVPIKAFVTFGVERSTRTTLDQGAKRTIGHILAMGGYLDYNNLAHAAAIACAYFAHKNWYRHNKIRPTTGEVEAYVAKHHKSLAEGIVHGRVAKKYKIANVSLFAGAYHILARKDREAAEAFVVPLLEGIGFKGKSDPIYVLRQRLVNGYGEIEESEVVAFIIKAWNAHRSGNPIKQLKWIAGESFPIAE